MSSNIGRYILVFSASIALASCWDGNGKNMERYVTDYFDESNGNIRHLRDTTTRSRSKRYVLSKGKWPHRTLRWRLHNNQLSRNDRYIIRSTLHRAFDVWAEVSSLQFMELKDSMDTTNNNNDEHSQHIPTDIDILFVKGKHGDGLPFDGPEGVVAHAFYPTVGALHFDADENWTLNSDSGINFFQTAVHEIGHLLGLEHSTDPRAVMFPKYRKFSTDFDLADDDIRGVRSLYPLTDPKN
ncbi:matrixin domain-containing protein [Ditylenchus destructor]|uniref:Matrixin domain-containing protein n=1 Tax=Ditylenchus destructor TaxID=166010 RepID=A0AAD4N703_9BILA|nr:matrixin domain-containing protein [Ditylenchus destructor]